MICSINVDLPIPGSPPIKTSDPGTIPPPKTRFNSSDLVGIRSSFSAFILSNLTGSLIPVFLIKRLAVALVERFCTSSVSFSN